MKTIPKQSFPANGNICDVASLLRRGGRRFLVTLKQKAQRTNNTWYRTLSPDKRRYIEAVIQTLERITSQPVLKILVPLAERLLQALGQTGGLGKLACGMQSFGVAEAQKISKIAQRLGNPAAVNWANEAGFIRYLTVIAINSH